MADLFKILDGINSSDYAAQTLASVDDIIDYAEAAGEKISADDAKRIQAVGLKWRTEQDGGNGEWSRMRDEAEKALSE